MEHGEQPVSRVWACVFSFSIFAVLWTNKMKKTRRWAVLFSLLVLVQVGDVMLYAYDDDYRYYSDWWIPQYSSPYLENLMQGIVPDVAAYAVSVVLTIAWDWVVWIGIIFAMVYYMFKWTTRYNFENFGYKSKRDWKREDPAQKNVEDVVVDAGKKAADGLKGIGRKIPSEGIKGAGAAAGKKMAAGATAGKRMADAASKSGKMNSNKAREEIEKYHGMMLRGVISESDFERKKNQLLGLDPEK